MKNLFFISFILFSSLELFAQNNNHFHPDRPRANTGSYNTFIGRQSGIVNTTGHRNTFLGANSGQRNNSGEYNTFVGAASGMYNREGGNRNTFVGAYSGLGNTSGADNTFVGSHSGEENTTGNHNTFLGSGSGTDNTSGERNTFLGRWSGFRNTTGFRNAFVGSTSGYNNTTGERNAFLGSASGYNNTSGIRNTFIGNGAGYYNTTGDRNVYVGRTAGYNNITGNGNVLLGNEAGYNETGSNKLYIANSSNSTLIYGDFSSRNVGINTTSPGNTLDVNGGIDISNYIRHNGDENTTIGFAQNDEIRLKTNGTDRLYVKNNGNIGIGISTPDSKLDVSGGIDINDYIRHNGDENTTIGFAQNDEIRLKTNGTDRLYVKNNGNIGIGISTPDSKLDVSGGIDINDYIRHNGDENTTIGFAQNDEIRLKTNGSDRVSVKSNGNVGIGTLSPSEKLSVFGGLQIGNTQSLNQGTIRWTGADFEGYNGNEWVSLTRSEAGIANIDPIYITEEQNIGIGTEETGSFKLAVDGSIGARGVHVTNANPWPDYVFADDYDLPSLNSVKEYINKEKHLSEIPSAKEIEKNGHDLGEMDAKLLKKIEELTLYTIKQQELIDKQNDVIQKFETRLNKLENK